MHNPGTGRRKLMKLAPDRRSAELPDLGLQQPPAFAAELLLPGRIDARKARAEGGLVDFVERNSTRHESVAQAGVELALLLALLTHVFGGVPLDHHLDLLWKRLPRGKMSHEVEARPHMVGHADIAHHVVELVTLHDRERVLLRLDLAALQRVVYLIGGRGDRLRAERREGIEDHLSGRNADLHAGK